MSARELWIEWTTSEYGHPKVEFDHDRSALGSGDFKYQDAFDPAAGDCFLKFPRNAGALVDTLILPSTLLALVVRGPAWEDLSGLTAGHHHARPIKVATRDGMLADYMAVKPAEVVECIDFEKSDGIEWAIPGRFTNCWKRLVFREGCLGELPWARVDHIDRLAVNEEIKRRLSELDPKGINFVRLEDLPPMRKPHR